MGFAQQPEGTEDRTEHKDGDEGLERGGHRRQGNRKAVARGGAAGEVDARLSVCAGAVGLVRWRTS
jgi:hypothetical protein